MANPFKYFRQRWALGIDQDPELDPVLDPQDYVMSGVDTLGCDCGHEEMGLKWHLLWCQWRIDQTRED